MMKTILVTQAFIIFTVISNPVYAYVGPGLGLGVMGVVVGVVISIFLAIVAVFWYPFKRWFKKKQKKQ